MKRIILTIFLCIFLLSSVQALTIKEGDNINLSHPVRIDEFPSSQIDCNITIYNPHNNVIIEYQPMDNNYDRHSYFLNGSNTTALGDYTYDITCTTGLSNKTESFSFEVTESGFEKSVPSAVFVVLIIIGIGYILIFIGFKLEELPFMIFGSFILIGVSIYIILNGIGNYSNDNIMVISLSLVNLGIAFYIMVKGSLDYLDLI